MWPIFPSIPTSSTKPFLMIPVQEDLSLNSYAMREPFGFLYANFLSPYRSLAPGRERSSISFLSTIRPRSSQQVLDKYFFTSP